MKSGALNFVHLVIVATIAITACVAIYLPLHYDSSYNLLLARTFADTGRYATDMYILRTQEYFPVDGWITTGYPVLMPIAQLWRLVASAVALPRAIMLVWGILFLWGSIRAASSLFPKLPRDGVAMLVATLFLSQPLLVEGSIHSLGDLPATVFSLAAIGLLNKLERHPLSAFAFGLACGFAVVSKTIFVFALTPFAVWAICRLIKVRPAVGSSWRQSRWASCLVLVLGGVIPLLFQFFLIYRQMDLAEWWKAQQLIWMTQQAGVHFAAFADLQSLWKRIQFVFSTDPLFAFSGLFVIILFIRFTRFRHPALLALSSVYLLLTLFQINLIPRHNMLNTFYASLILLLFLIEQSATHLKLDWSRMRFYLWPLFILAFIRLLNLTGVQSPPLTMQRAAATFTNQALPDATIFFPGWWKAPDIQLLSGRRFIQYDLELIKQCKPPCFLLTDALMKQLSPAEYETVRSQFGTPAYQFGAYSFYRVSPSGERAATN